MKLGTMGEATKQVRVDNWGIFFLQRLQMFFSKTDYCDMTLQFEGNVQLKVHRLVMNACTEYFQFLEQTCTLEDNVIMMPSDLQADVIVPIVNFMYTGMLEFHLSIFDRLYKTAQIMNITILTKLLDAQKQPITPVKSIKKKHIETPLAFSTPAKKLPAKPHTDLPATLPGRKLPIWKRKSIPTSSQSFSDQKWNTAVDPLSVPDNTPKPTRFEWPDDDLPPLNPMDTSFEEISYTSKPLLTLEEEQRATTSFDDLRQLPNANRTTPTPKKQTSPTLDMEEMKNYVKEQKIRSGLTQEIDEDFDIEAGQKRKLPEQKNKTVVKKVRFDEQDSKTTTISIDAKSAGDLNHEKIVTEILKKYPQLVKKNKNIRLKIMAKNKESLKVDRPKLKVTEIQKVDSPKTRTEGKEDKAPWSCERCSTEEEPVEFVLYYLYRKHMTDVHNEKFDPRLCKYCGHRCNKTNLLMYHLHTKHGMKPPPGYIFPKCDQCPFIALSHPLLSKHKLRHTKNEIQCVECKLAFTSQHTLTSHIQITGHTGKSNKNNYDCQYCTKRFQSGANLFAHVRGQHKSEALRDGIVSIDEMDEMDELDEDEVKDEYILPEIISDSDTQPEKKVNILSNVKVQDRQEHSRHQQLTLEPSSEAEALNNVATGIATSLGLVDIVVLNDNQQIFLQSNQGNFNNDQNEQPEFILPEMTSRDSFTQNQNEVITTDGVLTQSMLSTSDIGSTDELVMVLTDHDYGDNQEEMNNDNSNIVVLYSHPVDGQQDQFITSQGNIMVNSQGLIEIRNGATITSTANQVVMNPQDSHIESIEMIQREIESHQEMKQEALFEEESKPEVQNEEQTQVEIKESESVTLARNDPLIETLTQGEQLEFTSPLVPPEEALNPQQPPEETPNSQEPDTPSVVEETTESTEENKKSEENETVEKELENKITEEEPNKTVEEKETIAQPEEVQPPLPEPDEKMEIESDEKMEVEPNETMQAESDEKMEVEPVDEPSGVSKELPQTIEVNDTEKNTPPTPEKPLPEEPEKLSEDEPAGLTEETPNEKLTETESTNDQIIPVEEEEEEDKKTVTEKSSDDVKSDELEIDEELAEDSPEDHKTQEETSNEQELIQSDTSTSQFQDENSQSSQDSQKETPQTTKISILDDWEDTDSQQSDQKEKKVADETVHKLMDDWEEEEEDESRKETEG